MSVEVEIKLKIEDPEQMIEKLEGLGLIKGEQLLESDTYFTSENHDFEKLGEALRVRQIRNVDTDEISAVITYKGKKLDDRSIAREELELEIMVETEAEREGALQRIENVLVSLGYSMKDTTRHSYLSMLTDQTCAMEVAHEHYI